MKPADWPYVVSVTCHKHKNTLKQQRPVPKTPQGPALGQRVIGRNADGWYSHCTIIGMATLTLYEVSFDDGSYCDNLHPENILSLDCLRHGPPEKGEMIVVGTSEGKVLKATFIKQHVHKFYQVEFQDQSQLMLKHYEIYSLEQDLPKRVRAKLAILLPQKDPSPQDGARAAKRRCVPSGSSSRPPATVPTPEIPMETTETPCPLPAASATAPHSVNTSTVTSPALAQASPVLSQDAPALLRPETSAQTDGPQVDSIGAMDTSVALSDTLTESPLTSDPTLGLQATPFQSTLNSDPLLSVPSPPLPPQHLSNSYTASGYVSYMESLLNAHFPQEDGAGPLY